MNTNTPVKPLDGMAALKARIASTIAAHPDLKARWKAMRNIKWRMYSPQLGLWAGMNGLEIVPVTDPVKAVLFDARDNEEHKLRFYRASTGILWEVECLCEF